MKRILYKGLPVLLLLVTYGINAQKQTKTFKEIFNVNKDAVLDINTSNTDIEFETWNKDQILVETVLEIEGMSAKEAAEYFERNGVNVIGNSKKVEISTSGDFFDHFFNSGEKHAIKTRRSYPIAIQSQNKHFPRKRHINSDSLHIITAPFASTVSVPKFDYKVYEKDGEKYLAEWQKKFVKEFDEKKVKELEEWAKKIEKNTKKMAERAEVMANRAEMMAKKHEKRYSQNIERMVSRAIAVANRDNILISDSIVFNAPNVFYFSFDGKDKHVKVKKTIKVKMPKSATIKMNVRHGEVKLAENTKNIRANLNYSSLLASTIDGEDTYVTAAYSPVSVSQWNLGQLKADYSEPVTLKTVKDLKLSSVSSTVEIGKLLKTAYVQNDFGKVIINTISNDFSTLDVSLQNGELECNLPNSSYTVYVKGTLSNLATPAKLVLNKTKNQNTIVHKGHAGSISSNKSITIASKYSDVVLK